MSHPNHLSRDHAFDRLQDVLVDLHEGGKLSPSEASKLSGLGEDVCRAVLEGLARAGLMSDEGGGAFIRRHLDLIAN